MLFVGGVAMSDSDVRTILNSALGALMAGFIVVVGAAALALATRLKRWGADAQRAKRRKSSPTAAVMEVTPVDHVMKDEKK